MEEICKRWRKQRRSNKMSLHITRNLRQHGDHARKIINSGNHNGVQIEVNYIGKSIKVEIMQFV